MQISKTGELNEWIDSLNNKIGHISLSNQSKRFS